MESARWLRYVGVIGLIGAGAGIAARSGMILALTAHLPAAKHHGMITSSDPLNFIFALAVIAFAHIHKTAAEIASENAQFV